jgi:arginine repressor
MVRTKVNKSKAIREALAAHKGKSPKEVAEILNKEGVKVTAMFVSNIKSKLSKTKGKRGRPKGSPASNAQLGLAEVKTAVTFVRVVGGLDQAKKLIALLEVARGE